jgi:hypothetical protein
MRLPVQILLSLIVGTMVVVAIAFSGVAQGVTQRVDLPFFHEHSDFDPESIKSFSAFPLYYVGESFEGLPLTAITRRLQTKRLGPEPGRANFVGFLYGDCEPGSDGGCPLPLEIQVWPACERTLSSYSMGGQPMPYEATTLRGVPAAFFDNGGRLELYTGRVTIVIFGMDREQIQRAADSLVEANFNDGTTGNLPAPAVGAIEGRLTCTDQENGLPLNDGTGSD